MSVFSYLLKAVVTLLLWPCVVAAVRVVYNILFHPLRKFPGPLACRATNLWRVRRILAGDLPQQVQRLHEQYGPVVRISPDELAFIDSQAWKDIYGHHASYEMAKDDKFYRPLGRRVADTIISADRDHHSMLRRQLAHGFSERAMHAQEPIFREYMDLLIQRLAERADTGKPLDMTAWMNFITFDVISNLAFGSDFGCVENASYHPWVKAITGNFKDAAKMRVIIQFIPQRILFGIYKLGIFKGRKSHLSYTRDKLRRRLEAGTERPDFIEGLLKKKDISVEELEVNAAVLVLAGSETTATLLTGAMYLLGLHPEILAKVVREVRTSFKNEDEIDVISVGRLSYMLACLNESLRMYPPNPTGLPRVVPKGGKDVAGHWIPQDTSVAIFQLAANYSTKNFTKPEEFHPERFLGDPEFAKDDLNAVQPFSVGPRNCIGRNLAYAEMRLILARILYRFDIVPAPGSENWIKNQKIYANWDKIELPFYLNSAAKTS